MDAKVITELVLHISGGLDHLPWSTELQGTSLPCAAQSGPTSDTFPSPHLPCSLIKRFESKTVIMLPGTQLASQKSLYETQDPNEILLNKELTMGTMAGRQGGLTWFKLGLPAIQESRWI